jgi:PAS domain S-box-containing protein
MSQFIIKPENKMTFPWKLALIFLLFSGVIILMGISYYRYERNRIFTEQEESLSAIATLKIKQISQWYSDKLADAVLIKDNAPLADRIKEFLKDENQTGPRKEITIWLESLNTQYDYNSVAVLDTSLRIRLSTSRADPMADDSIRAELNNVIRNHKIVMTDLHKTGTSQTIRMDLLVPLLDPISKEQNSIGLVILSIDPGKILFPLVQSWPTPSKSSETLILRKDGDSVLYLNELRHRKNSALNLKLPLNEKNLLASKLVNGFVGLTEGVDYRNMPVIGALSKIPGLPWYMVAKTDKKEILAPFKRYSVITVLVIILLIIINASIFGFWIWQQRIKFYRSQLKNEAALFENEKRLREAQEMAHLGFWLWDIKTGNVEWSEEVYKIFCLNPETFTPKIDSILELSPWPEDHQRDKELIARAMKTHTPGDYEQKFLRPDKSVGFYYSTFRGNYDNSGELISIVGTVLDITERKLAEDALRESEDKFKYVFDHSVAGKSITFPSGEIHVNKAFCEMTGYSSEELADTKWQDISHPDDIKITENELQLLISGEKKSTRFIKRYIHKNGNIVWTDLGTALRRDENGKPLYFMTTTIDITERKLAEEALSESEERFSKSFRTSPISFMIANIEDGRIIEVNDAFTTISGYTREEALSSTTLNLKIWVNEQDRKNMIDSLSMGKPILHQETLLRSKGGDISTVLLSAQLIKLGNRDCIISSIEDITKRKEAEAEVRIQSEILSHIAEAVYLVRMEDGIIVYTNSRFEELFGYSQGEMIGKHVSIVNAPAEKSPDQTAAEIMNDLERNGYWAGEVLNIKKDGTVFWSHAHVAIFDHSKFGKVLVSVQEDITDRKNSEFQIKKLNEELEGRVIQRTELLEAANKELEAFSYSVSHDLRAPLRAVHGYSKILLEDYEDKLDDEGKRVCNIIASSATQMGGLIDDLLSFSRIGRNSMNPELLNMKTLVISIFADIAGEREKEKIIFKIGKLHKAYGDANLIKIAWNNLITNAIKYSSKRTDSKIEIDSIQDGEMITYCVKDNGVGFDMQYKHKLFGVFQRLHSESEFEGNGVGLAIVQRIISKHGGKVWAEGEVGKGATFYFSLPVEGDGQQPTGKPKA